MLAEITALGAVLVAISPQTEKRNESIQRQKSLGFPVLSDPGNRVAEAFGVKYAFSPELRTVYEDVFRLRVPLFNGDDSWTLPMPARYVVDQDGVIRYAAVNPDYTVRPEPSLTVEALEKLA